MSQQISTGDATEVFRAALKSQYRAALSMLRQTIEQCPDALWSSGAYTNPFWRIAYHALFYTHLYLQPHEDVFRPWEHHRTNVEHMDDAPEPPGAVEPYTKAEVLAYWSVCEQMIDDAVDALDLLDPESGFSWKKTSKAENQIANVRHLQHHAAQLVERLRAAEGIGTEWVGRHTASPPNA